MVRISSVKAMREYIYNLVQSTDILIWGLDFMQVICTRTLQNIYLVMMETNTQTNDIPINQIE